MCKQTNHLSNRAVDNAIDVCVKGKIMPEKV